MTALLGDAVIVDNDNAVGIFKGRKAVGNGKGGTSRFKAVDGPLYHKFAFGVEAGGGFVENEYLGIGKNGPRNGYSLTFSARKAVAFFAYIGIISVGEFGR